MHMKKTLAPLAALLLTATALSAKDNTYTNPVYPKDWPDPTVWQAADGKFYCLSTGQNARRPLLCSDDLVNWGFSDIVPLDRSIMKQFRSIGRHVWAPDVAMVNGRRMAYFTLYNSLKDASIVALRESTTPGKFEYVGVITRGKDTGIDDTIDPEVVTDPATGKVWLFFGSMGRIHRIELSEYGSQLAEGARYEAVAGVHGSKDPDRGRVFEGAYLHYRKGYWYMFVSSGHYWNETYQIKVGRSRTLDGEFTDREGRPMKEGYATTVIRSEKGDHFYGPGHNGEIFTDKKGHDWMLYHCHNKDVSPNARPMMLQRILWDKKGWPYVKDGKPTVSAPKPKF